MFVSVKNGPIFRRKTAGLSTDFSRYPGRETVNRPESHFRKQIAAAQDTLCGPGNTAQSAVFIRPAVFWNMPGVP